MSDEPSKSRFIAAAAGARGKWPVMTPEDEGRQLVWSERVGNHWWLELKDGTKLQTFPREDGSYEWLPWDGVLPFSRIKPHTRDR